MHHLASEETELVVKEVPCWPANRKWNSKDKDVQLSSFFGANGVVIADLWNRICNRDGLLKGCHQNTCCGRFCFSKCAEPRKSTVPLWDGHAQDFFKVGMAHGENDFQIER